MSIPEPGAICHCDRCDEPDYFFCEGCMGFFDEGGPLCPSCERRGC